ncbi:glycosyl hydrolase family 47-domain-containing protein [Phyllosticta citricarpa]|uniref:alpha-1,2-Mannosidase n=1 Tax=Phyllosticta citricarpa TaxID=55181 RepID=A0ABR1LHA7_9PEZI
MLSFWPALSRAAPNPRASNSAPRWGRLRWTALFWLLECVALSTCMTDELLRNLKQETTDIFYHGYDNYMKYAFPEDELRPLSCSSLTRDRANPAHIEVNDVLGNYSLTLIDSLSTLAILASSPATSSGRDPLGDFQNGVQLFVEHYGDGSEGPAGQGSRSKGFDLDSKVQVFETVIRGLGGLLSAHLFAIGQLPIRGYEAKFVKSDDRESGIEWPGGFIYNGQLLRLAQDLGKRILPAFHTPTGIPYPRVNLRTGIPFYANSPLNTDAEHGQCKAASNESPEITETCSAGAGSLVLEFSTLSRLTGDPTFEKLGKAAFWAIWSRRSSSGLIGSGIDAETGQWVSPYTGIGAGIDSFFEYAFKSHILLSGLPSDPIDDRDSPEAFLRVWHESHAGIKRHIYRGPMHQHPHYIQVDLYTGAMRAFWIDSLSAYYPGLLTFAGELDEAIETHLLYTALWTRYSALPERWSTATGNIEMGLRWWGGRPEFIESTWYLYRATRDPWYLHVGEMALRDIKRRCWTSCGWAGLQDVRSGEKSDRMESFFLGETAKYLFLLFDNDHPLNQVDAPWVFTTEGHPLIMPKHLRQNATSRTSSSGRHQSGDSTPQCPLPPAQVPFTMSATAARDDVFHAASLARLHLMPSRATSESPLIEFTTDHPSISLSDLHSPSNYTYFPWTLPPQLVPHNATSSRMVARTTFDLSFPNLPNAMLNTLSLQRIGGGIMVNSMSGLRLGMVRESEKLGPQAGESSNDMFRIYAVSNVALGRDEKVYMSRDLMSSFNPADPYFTRTRDLTTLDLFIDAPEVTTQKSAAALAAERLGLKGVEVDTNSSDGFLSLPDGVHLESVNPSLFSNLLQNFQSILTEGLEPLTRPSTPQKHLLDKGRSSKQKQGGKGRRVHRIQYSATLSTGPGAVPPPSGKGGDELATNDKKLPWQKIFVGDDNCDGRLAPEIPKDYQIIVLKRGGCSFSEKLANIPAYPPSPQSLQLVIMVSYPEQDKDEDPDADLVQPFLHEEQKLPGGIKRPHPIPLVMVGGGEQTYEILSRAIGVGVRRRWWYESQGLRIGNLIVV